MKYSLREEHLTAAYQLNKDYLEDISQIMNQYIIYFDDKTQEAGYQALTDFKVIMLDSYFQNVSNKLAEFYGEWYGFEQLEHFSRQLKIGEPSIERLIQDKNIEQRLFAEFKGLVQLPQETSGKSIHYQFDEINEVIEQTKISVERLSDKTEIYQNKIGDLFQTNLYFLPYTKEANPQGEILINYFETVVDFLLIFKEQSEELVRLLQYISTENIDQSKIELSIAIAMTITVTIGNTKDSIGEYGPLNDGEQNKERLNPHKEIDALDPSDVSEDSSEKDSSRSIMLEEVKKIMMEKVYPAFEKEINPILLNHQGILLEVLKKVPDSVLEGVIKLVSKEANLNLSDETIKSLVRFIHSIENGESLSEMFEQYGIDVIRVLVKLGGKYLWTIISRIGVKNLLQAACISNPMLIQVIGLGALAALFMVALTNDQSVMEPAPSTGYSGGGESNYQRGDGTSTVKGSSIPNEPPVEVKPSSQGANRVPTSKGSSTINEPSVKVKPSSQGANGSPTPKGSSTINEPLVKVKPSSQGANGSPTPKGSSTINEPPVEVKRSSQGANRVPTPKDSSTINEPLVKVKPSSQGAKGSPTPKGLSTINEPPVEVEPSSQGAKGSPTPKGSSTTNEPSVEVKPSSQGANRVPTSKGSSTINEPSVEVEPGSQGVNRVPTSKGSSTINEPPVEVKPSSQGANRVPTSKGSSTINEPPVEVKPSSQGENGGQFIAKDTIGLNHVDGQESTPKNGKNGSNRVSDTGNYPLEGQENSIVGNQNNAVKRNLNPLDSKNNVGKENEKKNDSNRNEKPTLSHLKNNQNKVYEANPKNPLGNKLNELLNPNSKNQEKTSPFSEPEFKTLQKQLANLESENPDNDALLSAYRNLIGNEGVPVGSPANDEEVNNVKKILSASDTPVNKEDVPRFAEEIKRGSKLCAAGLPLVDSTGSLLAARGDQLVPSLDSNAEKIYVEDEMKPLLNDVFSTYQDDPTAFNLFLSRLFIGLTLGVALIAFTAGFSLPITAIIVIKLFTNKITITDEKKKNIAAVNTTLGKKRMERMLNDYSFKQEEEPSYLEKNRE
ncbi:hypothetical protein [Carnobacterium sp. TMP28]|uniref:hypothetical protein n=1 Tax=Carnobacterium sp. TMP28 TaxID=3397060 RepID=UPI0039DFF176